MKNILIGLLSCYVFSICVRQKLIDRCHVQVFEVWIYWVVENFMNDMYKQCQGTGPDWNTRAQQCEKAQIRIYWTWVDGKHHG